MLVNLKSAIAPPNQSFDPAMFSLVETESCYMIAVDIPAIPSLETEIVKSQDQLTVEGRSETTKAPQTILRLLSKGRGIKTVYRDGVLWLLLPKTKVKSEQRHLSVVAV